jgi:hypothetical protein
MPTIFDTRGFEDEDAIVVVVIVVVVGVVCVRLSV